MRRLLVCFALALAAALAPADGVAAPHRGPAIPPTPPDLAAKMSALFAKAPPAVRTWVDAEARKLRLIPRVDPAMVSSDARRHFAATHVPALTPGQTDVLAAMAIYQNVKDLESEARLKQLADKGDPSPQDMATLAQMMEKKKQMEALIASLLRASSEADAAVVSSLK
jgi:hypothetical protein